MNAPDWHEFVQAVAQLSEAGDAPIERNTKLVADLDLDSLAIIQLIVLLVDKYEMAGLIDDLETRDWSKVSVGDLFDEANRPRGL